MENILLDAMNVSLGVQLLITHLFTIHHPVIHGHNGKLNTNQQQHLLNQQQQHLLYQQNHLLQEKLIWNLIQEYISQDVMGVERELILIQLPFILQTQMIHGLHGHYKLLDLKLLSKLILETI